MRWSSGMLHSPERDNRVVNSISTDYTIYKDGTLFYGECNYPGGTDVTPNSNALTVAQSAVDAVEANGGGTVLLKTGVYDFAGSLTIDSPNVQVWGEGKGTEIKQSTGVASIKVDSTTNVVVGNMYFNGQNVANATGVLFTGCNYCHATLIWAYQCRYGVWLYGSNYCTVDRCVCSDSNARDGIHVSDNSNRNVIHSNVCYGNQHYGIEVAASDYNIVTNNVCYSNLTYSGVLLWDADFNTVVDNVLYLNGQHGVYLAYGSVGCRWNIIADNKCIANTLCGIHLYTGGFNNVTDNICTQNGTYGILAEVNSYSNRVDGNLVYYNTATGIQLTDSSKNQIEDNYCYNNDSGDTDTYDGIRLSSNSDNNFVTGNYCSGSIQNRGIQVAAATCNDNVIADNYLVGNKNGAIGDAGTATVIYGNEGYDDDYQTQTGSWAAPSGTGFNGRKVVVYNSTQGGSRLYCYSNGAWTYVALT